MVGRGTRIHPNKENLLLLDFLWLSHTHDLIKPAALIAKDEQQAAEIEAQLDKSDGDLLRAESNAQTAREAALKRRLERARERDGSEIDLLELANSWQAPEIVRYEPTFVWEQKPLTEKQIAVLQRNGVAPSIVQNRGHASVILSSLFAFKEREPATEKQRWFCHYRAHPDPWGLTKRDASRWIAKQQGRHANFTG